MRSQKYSFGFVSGNQIKMFSETFCVFGSELVFISAVHRPRTGPRPAAGGSDGRSPIPRRESEHQSGKNVSERNSL